MLLFQADSNTERKYSFVFGIFLRMDLVAQNWSSKGQLKQANPETMASKIAYTVD